MRVGLSRWDYSMDLISNPSCPRLLDFGPLLMSKHLPFISGPYPNGGDEHLTTPHGGVQMRCTVTNIYVISAQLYLPNGKRIQ
nr:hypothetical protein HmN_000703700 [Hymenolepis microstoma]